MKDHAKQTTEKRRVRPYALIVALLAGAGWGAACANDSDVPVSNLRIQTSCRSYCEQANMCRDSVDVDECRADCEDNITDCMADEQREAVNEIEECSEESCDDFTGCTIGAGLTCAFGI